MLSPDEKFAWCLDDKVNTMRRLAAKSSKPEHLNDYYPKWDAQIEACRALVQQPSRAHLDLENHVRVRMRQVLGEVTEDYLAEMELVRGGHRSQAEAEDSWRMWAVVGVAEVAEVIPK